MKRALIAACILCMICALYGVARVPFGGFSMAPSARAESSDLRHSYRRVQENVFPEDNPYTEAKYNLGKMLFFDPIMSGSRSTSCATCHNPNLSWGDGLPRAIGEARTPLSLRAPTLLDVGSIQPLGWDGKFKDLESVPYGPILNPTNMNLTEAEVNKRLSDDETYVRLFSDAFSGGTIDRRNVEVALATFVRTIVSGEAPFDRWINGDESAINASAKRGFTIFNGKAKCAGCHSGPSFTDGSFHDIGSAEGNDIGRGRLFPSSKTLRYAFKTPTLRDVARRAPYMHDGAVATLDEVIGLYDKGGIDRPSRSPLIKPLSLTATEKTDLIAFLKTLTGEAAPVKTETIRTGGLAGERHALMMANGKNQYGVLGRMRRGMIPYEQDAVNSALEQLEETARKMPALFSDPQSGRNTLASPKIWTNKGDFLAHVSALKPIWMRSHAIQNGPANPLQKRSRLRTSFQNWRKQSERAVLKRNRPNKPSRSV